MASGNELRDIKKEIIEARGLIIKSNNLANSLSAEVRGIAKRQTSYERQMTWNSIAAYIIFAVLIFIGVKLAYDVKHSALEESIETATQRAQKAEGELKEFKKEKRADPETQEQDLLALYEIIKDKERQEAIDAWEALDHDQLTTVEAKLLKDTIDSFRADLSMQHYARALDLMDKNKHAEAVEEFRSSLRFKGDAGHATAAKIEMGNALRLQGKPREAIAILQRLLEQHMDRALSDDALWYLALAHQEAHQKDEARSVLRSLMRQFPDSQYYRAARIRAAEIQLRLYSSKDD